MQRAARASQGLGEANEKTAQQSQSAMQRMARSARENRAEWQQVGGALTVVGGAVTGLMTLVAATGIGYNNLRQTATASLTSVTGSTEEAAAQMQRLDDFGKNSWLMRDVLVRAQQDMTGFGIETSKAVPYMAALAEAVAGTTGSQQNFEELARLMGQIESQSKITATELQQFGLRGIDAAEMIGVAMGKTAGEIRDEITAGTLDATVALDALAEGMMTTFEGSSDLIRNTFSGAVDDVMAAFRDIFAIAMSPLVNPEGGGLLTSLIGQVADLMFALRELPPWMIQVGGGVAALGGMAATAAGGFMLLAPRLVDTWDALGKMGTVGPRAQDALRGVAPYLGRIAAMGAAAGVTAVAVGSLVSALTRPGVARSAENVASAIQQMVTSGERLTDLGLDGFMSELSTIDLGFFEVARTEAEDLADVLEKLANPSLTDNLSQFFGTVIPGATSYMEDYKDMLASFGDGMTYLVDHDLPAAQEAFVNLADAMGVTTDQGALELIEQIPGLRDALIGIATDAGLASDDVTLLRIAMGLLTPETDTATTAVHGFEGAIAEMAEAQAEANSQLEAWIDAMGNAAASFGGVIDGYNAAAEAADAGTASMSDWISEMEAQAEAVANWRENTLTASGQIREDLPADMHESGGAFITE